MAFFNIHFISCLLFVLILIIPYVTSLTFNFTNIRPQNENQEIHIEGDGGYVSENGIQVTPDVITSDQSQKAGRATYYKPLHLWDSRSDELASFSTSFTFVIDSNKNKSYGDGLTFFLARNNSVISADNGAMGLPIIESTTAERIGFVAVEFDTSWDSWDPLDSSNTSVGDHVGISVNSLISVRSQKWSSNVTGGGVCQAWITYDSDSKNLSVLFTGYQNNRVVRQDGLFFTVDLRNELPEWVIFGFSAATGATFQKNNVRSWAFNSSDLQEKGIPSNTAPDSGNSKGSKVGIIAGIASVTIISVFVLVLVLWMRKKKKSREDKAEVYNIEVEMNNEFETGTGPKRFSYQELARITDDFSDNEKLGEGGFGAVYRGFLKDSNTYVAVKRVSKNSKQGIKEYASEVRIISRLRHKNLVELKGWCHEKGELLLVYEYMENRSLDSHLFKSKSLLTWGTRYKIAQGLASALLYLHDEWEQCVLHRDIKSSNVMLDSNFNAKLGDFGLAKLVDHVKDSETTMLAGTMGYMAPECIVTGKATKKSDVYSFGVVALEITCGRKPIRYEAQKMKIRLVEWVWELYGKGSLLQAVDPHLVLDYKEEELTRLMILGLWCVHPDSERRPSMRQVIQVLNFEASLPILPSKMPVASYLSPPIFSLYGTNSITRKDQNQSSSNISNTHSFEQPISSTNNPSPSPSVSLLYSAHSHV
uniref:L-type lectin-domain containing receptor kinase IX.1-like n=1 Tax=Erigeron canadensis TaxID=72917 RepID=UPI001CB91CDF|nr:L-type lectin-domain containing receptor kinase IX.1-like [Erigeron canadensis]